MTKAPAQFVTGAVLLLLAAAPGLTGCGGGGGAKPPAPPIAIDIGLQSATVPSQVGRSFLNPLTAPATVEAVPEAGPFAFGPANLGTQVAALGTVSLDLVFTPAGPGVATGPLTLRWTSATKAIEEHFEVTATGEPFSWSVTPEPVDFGDILPGDELEIEVRLRNNSQRSPVTFTTGSLPSGAFAFVGTPFPQTVQPGQSAILSVRFAPTVVANQGGVMRIGLGDPGGPVDIPLWANSTGAGEKVIDFGTQALDGTGTTPELSLDVPADAVSITLEGRMTASAKVGLRSFVGPAGRVYENSSQTGALLWQEAKAVFSTHIPSSDSAATQLVGGGGTYTFQLYRHSGSGTTMQVRAILERRPGGTLTSSVLPLNVFLAPGITPSAATAASDAKLQGAISRMGQTLQQRGVTLGAITYYDISDPAFNAVAQGEEEQLFVSSVVAAKTRLNLFFVQSVWSGQLLGIAGDIDGARRNGEVVTGVVVQYDQLDADTVGLTAAHECCHYLGLWHTVESTGVWDLIADTPNCPAVGTSASCSTPGGGLLMHWQSLGGTTLSAGQGLVIRAHAHMHPPGQGEQKPQVFPLTPLSAQALVELEHLPPGWCGTLRRR